MSRAAARAVPPAAPLTAVAAALGVVYVVWGSTYLAIRVAIDTMPPLLMAAVRFLVAGAALYAWAVRRGDRVADRPGRPQWLAALVVGTALLAVGNGGVTWGEQYVPSSIVALLVASVPLWMALFSHVQGRERLRPGGAAGIAVGLLGVALLLRPGAAGGVSLWTMLAVLVAPLCWAAGSLYVPRAPLPSRPLVATGMEMLCGGLVLLAAAAASGELGHVHLAAFALRSVVALLYLMVFGSLLAFTAYVWLLRVAAPSLVATYAYVNPLVAVLLGRTFLSEPITAQTLVAAGLIIAAVALILAPAGRRRARPAAPPEQSRDEVRAPAEVA